MNSRMMAVGVAVTVAAITSLTTYFWLTGAEDTGLSAPPVTAVDQELEPAVSAPTVVPTTTSSTVPETTAPSTTTPATTTTEVSGDQPGPDGSYPVPGSIDSSCGVDVTENLNAWVASVPNGSVLDFGNGCYRIDGLLLIEGRSGLTLKAGDAVLNGQNHLGPTGQRHVDILRSQGISIIGFEIIGAHASAGGPEFPAWGCPSANGDCHGHHGIGIEASSDVLISGNYIHNVFGDLVYVGMAPGQGDYTNSSNVTIKGNVLVGSGRQGVSVTSGVNIVISGNTIGDARANLIDVEPGNTVAVIDNVVITGNTFGDRRVAAVTLTGGGACGTFTGVTITANVVEETDSTWPSVYGTSPQNCPARSGLTVTDNVLEANAAGLAIDVSGWVDVVTEPNTIIGFQ